MRCFKELNGGNGGATDENAVLITPMEEGRDESDKSEIIT